MKLIPGSQPDCEHPYGVTSLAITHEERRHLSPLCCLSIPKCAWILSMLPVSPHCSGCGNSSHTWDAASLPWMGITGIRFSRITACCFHWHYCLQIWNSNCKPGQCCVCSFILLEKRFHFRYILIYYHGRCSQECDTTLPSSPEKLQWHLTVYFKKYYLNFGGSYVRNWIWWLLCVPSSLAYSVTLRC